MKKLTLNEIKCLKKEVKAKTGINMCELEILSECDEYIEYGYYKTNYDKVINRMTTERIKR